MAVKKVAILGSTGSIGINTLKVIDRLSDKFKVVGLTAYNNLSLLEKQIRKYKPTHVAATPKGSQYLRSQMGLNGLKILDVNEELAGLVSLKSVDIVVIGMRGSAALKPFLAALKSGKTVAPANKEALVVAGDILMAQAKKSKATIVPVDSEQSAIFQCLEGHNRKDLHKVYLTASGGTLHNVARKDFNKLSVKQILNHPRWKMGRKITVDSATLMNKGFEVIEAARLFNLKVDDIEVVIHPEAIIHSMVGFRDGSIIAQLGITDMRLPIQYALTYPKRFASGLKEMDFFKLKKLTFDRPDLGKFPALELAYHVGRKGGTFPSVLNAVDEEAVEAFLNKRISFTQIIAIVEKVVLKHRHVKKPNLQQIIEADQWARQETKKLINK